MPVTTVDRSRLPEPGAVRPFAFPAIEKSGLANGLRIWTVPHLAIPVVTLMLLLRRGAADDPIGREGLAAITVDMLDEGSGKRSAIEIHEALARLGAQLDSDIGPDAALLTVTVLSRFAAPALQLLADIVARPSLTEPDFLRVRELRLHRLTQLRDMSTSPLVPNWRSSWPVFASSAISRRPAVKMIRAASVPSPGQ